MSISCSKATRAVTNVESTALQVCWYRWQAAQRLSALDSPYALDGGFDALLLHGWEPSPEQASSISADKGPTMMAMRTISLDDALLAATGGQASTASPIWLAPSAQIRQVVLLGAGMDPRAWRLKWPDGVTVFEVDTGTLEEVKLERLGHMPLRCSARHAVTADLRDTDQLKSALEGVGFNPAQPTVWLMEGLIGYLTREDGLALLRKLLGLSAHGSRIAITAPPQPEMAEQAAQGGWKLFHTTIEQPEATLARVKDAGWTSAVLVTQAQLRETYGLDSIQPQIHAVKDA